MSVSRFITSFIRFDTLETYARRAPRPSAIGHDPEPRKEFGARYRAELRSSQAREMLLNLARRSGCGRVTLVYGARDTERNETLVLTSLIERLRA